MRLLKAIGIGALVFCAAWIFGETADLIYRVGLYFTKDPSEAIFWPYLALSIAGIIFIAFANSKKSEPSK